MSDELALAESQALTEHEAVIERGLNTFTEVGNALLAIRDGRLYRVEHDTFEDYCQQRWGFNRHRASQLISAAGVVTNVTSAGLPAPANEGQARELARVPESERAEVWQQTLERTDGKPTAAAIREVYAPAPVEKSGLAAITEDVTEYFATLDQQRTPDRDEQRREHLDSALSEFPELEHYADQPAKAVALATNLKQFAEPERSMRREVLAKAIAADKRTSEQPDEPRGPNYYELADAIFVALNAAAQAVARNGGAETIRQAIPGSPPLMVQTWREQFAGLSRTCAALADECTPRLRSVK